MLFQILRSYNNDRAITENPEILVLDHKKNGGPRLPPKFVTLALIGAEIDGGNYMPPSRRCDSQSPSSARVIISFELSSHFGCKT